jgi:hypothetical protein
LWNRFFFERNGKRLAVIFIRRKKEAQEASKLKIKEKTVWNKKLVKVKAVCD